MANVENTLAAQRELAARYGAAASPYDDILQFRIDNSGYGVRIWYSTYNRNIPWVVAKVTPIPEGERGAGQDMFSGHVHFSELESAFKYAVGV